jgi:hypothetical protein
VGQGASSPLRHVTIANTIPFGPLWFLAVYLVVVALSPWAATAHRRWGVAVPLAMLMLVAVADSQAFIRDSGSGLSMGSSSWRDPRDVAMGCTTGEQDPQPVSP